MSAAWQVHFILNKSDWQFVEHSLSDFYDAVVVKPVRENDNTSPEHVAIILPKEPDADEITAQLEAIFSAFAVDMPELTFEALPDIDWLQHVYDGLKPIDAGRFFVHGAHIKNDIPANKTAIIIEAASAFGTGEHPTTKGCLIALDKLLAQKQPKKILDMGTGSGILAIAVAMVAPETDKIIAVDIDLNSVRVAKNHADDNHVANRIAFQAGDGCRTPIVGENAPYDLTLANILAQPLMDMAPALCAVSSGDIILSGFTVIQLPYVEKAYLAEGCERAGMETIDEWVTLWLHKKN